MLPLYMQSDAELTLARIEAPAPIKNHALDILRLGYTVIRNCFPEAYCGAIVASFRQFEAANPDIFASQRAGGRRLPRIVNLHLAIKDLVPLFTQNSTLLAVQDLLFGRPTSLYTSIFYEKGSEQTPHRDTPVFCTRPEYLYFGNTVYLESADENNGCLEVIEGGHLAGELDRESMAIRRYGSLDEIPSIDNQLWNEYQNGVTSRCDQLNLPRRKLPVGAGDTIIWHPQLPHGGAPIRDATRTRFSLVFHTTPMNVPVYHQEAFFRPSRPMREKAGWTYAWVDGRAIAWHTNGTVFGGEPQHKAYGFKALRLPRNRFRHIAARCLIGKIYPLCSRLLS